MKRIYSNIKSKHYTFTAKFNLKENRVTIERGNNTSINRDYDEFFEMLANDTRLLREKYHTNKMRFNIYLER